MQQVERLLIFSATQHFYPDFSADQMQDTCFEAKTSFKSLRLRKLLDLLLGLTCPYWALIGLVGNFWAQSDFIKSISICICTIISNIYAFSDRVIQN